MASEVCPESSNAVVPSFPAYSVSSSLPPGCYISVRNFLHKAFRTKSTDSLFSKKRLGSTLIEITTIAHYNLHIVFSFRSQLFLHNFLFYQIFQQNSRNGYELPKLLFKNLCNGKENCLTLDSKMGRPEPSKGKFQRGNVKGM